MREKVVKKLLKNGCSNIISLFKNQTTKIKLTAKKKSFGKPVHLTNTTRTRNFKD